MIEQACQSVAGKASQLLQSSREGSCSNIWNVFHSHQAMPTEGGVLGSHGKIWDSRDCSRVYKGFKAFIGVPI